MNLDIRNGADYYNKVVLLTEKAVSETTLKIEDALKIDSYVEYSKKNYNNKGIKYIKYIIKEKILDNQGNLLLICDEEYHDYK